MYYLGIIWALGVWLALTLWTDLVVVPSVFRSGLGVYQAGEMGIKLFGLFNWLEVALALFIAGLVFFKLKAKKISKKDVVLFFPLILLAFLNCFYLSPSISEAFHSMSTSTPGGEVALKASQDYNFFHRLYVSTDSFKMIWIAVAHVITLLCYRKEQKMASQGKI